MLRCEPQHLTCPTGDTTATVGAMGFDCGQVWAAWCRQRFQDVRPLSEQPGFQISSSEPCQHRNDRMIAMLVFSFCQIPQFSQAILKVWPGHISVHVIVRHKLHLNLNPRYIYIPDICLDICSSLLSLSSLLSFTRLSGASGFRLAIMP